MSVIIYEVDETDDIKRLLIEKNLDKELASYLKEEYYFLKIDYMYFVNAYMARTKDFLVEIIEDKNSNLNSYDNYLNCIRNNFIKGNGKENDIVFNTLTKEDNIQSNNTIFYDKNLTDNTNNKTKQEAIKCEIKNDLNKSEIVDLINNNTENVLKKTENFIKSYIGNLTSIYVNKVPKEDNNSYDKQIFTVNSTQNTSILKDTGIKIDSDQNKPKLSDSINKVNSKLEKNTTNNVNSNNQTNNENNAAVQDSKVNVTFINNSIISGDVLSTILNKSDSAQINTVSKTTVKPQTNELNNTYSEEKFVKMLPITSPKNFTKEIKKPNGENLASENDLQHPSGSDNTSSFSEGNHSPAIPSFDEIIDKMNNSSIIDADFNSAKKPKHKPNSIQENSTDLSDNKSNNKIPLADYSLLKNSTNKDTLSNNPPQSNSNEAAISYNSTNNLPSLDNNYNPFSKPAIKPKPNAAGEDTHLSNDYATKTNSTINNYNANINKSNLFVNSKSNNDESDIEELIKNVVAYPLEINIIRKFNDYYTKVAEHNMTIDREEPSDESTYLEHAHNTNNITKKIIDLYSKSKKNVHIQMNKQIHALDNYTLNSNENIAKYFTKVRDLIFNSYAELDNQFLNLEEEKNITEIAKQIKNIRYFS